MTNTPTNTPPPLPPPPSRWKRRLLSLCLFLAGLICGIGLTILVAVHRIHYALQHPEQAPDRIAKLLTRRLDLTSSQSADVRAILTRHQHNLQTLRRQILPGVRQELDATRDDVSSVLDDRQRVRWQEMYDSLLAHWLPPDLPSTPASQSAQTVDSADQRTPRRGE